MKDVKSFVRQILHSLGIIFLIPSTPFTNIGFLKNCSLKKDFPVRQFISVWPAILQKDFPTALTKTTLRGERNLDIHVAHPSPAMWTYAVG